MAKRKEGPPEALRASGSADEEEGRRKVAEAVATLLESPYCPQELSDLVADHVIRISERTHLYIFAPEVVRRMYPLMCLRDAERAAEEERERRRRRRAGRASKARREPPPEASDAVN
jgi:hypothetical protein